MSETAVPIQASGMTGETCKVTGPYRSARSGILVFVLANTNFPPDADGASTTWSLVVGE